MGDRSPALSVIGLSRSFGPQSAVRDLSFEVKPGEVTCLLGRSGCGKSTTLRLIAGIDSPDCGRIAMGDKLLVGPQTFVPPEQRGVGLMFQDFALFPHLTVAQNVGFGLPRRPDRMHRIGEMLERVTLTHHAHSYPHQLSGGEQQRAALARAIAPRPKLILMDEPFSGLDERLRDEVRDTTMAMLRDDGAAVVLVTHEPDEALGMADQIVLMRDGQIEQIGSPQAIYNTPTSLYAMSFFSQVNALRYVFHKGYIVSPWGEIGVPPVKAGAVTLAIRAQDVRVGPCEGGAAARVRHVRYLGEKTVLDCTLLEHDVPITAKASQDISVSVGEIVHLSVNFDAIQMFGDDAPSAS
ncbi:MAG: ABC transporter ATP-binding protein [Pseudomonadota bacterium]